MQQELVLLIVTFPFFASFALVSCLKTHWRFKGQDKHDSSEVYVKTAVPIESTREKETKSRKNVEKKIKKTELKDEKGKKIAKFFIFNKKEEELKTPVVSDLSLDSTQNSDEEHESPLGSSYEFSDDEKLKGLQLLPSPKPDFVQRLRARVRRARRGKKSPQDYYYADEEDSLFNIPSLMHESLKSSASTAPLDIQDSRILRVQQDRLGYKKSHAVYARSSFSPISRRMNRLSSSSASSNSGTDTEPITIIQKS